MRDKATGDVKKRIDEKSPAPGDAHELYKYEYLNYSLAMRILLIWKDEATCKKENTWLENNKPELPLWPQPEDSETNDFVQISQGVQVRSLLSAQCSYPEAERAGGSSRLWLFPVSRPIDNPPFVPSALLRILRSSALS